MTGGVLMSGGLEGGPLHVFDQKNGICIMAPFSEVSEQHYVTRFSGADTVPWCTVHSVHPLALPAHNQDSDSSFVLVVCVTL